MITYQSTIIKIIGVILKTKILFKKNFTVETAHKALFTIYK